MAINDFKLDPQYPNYEVDFNTILFGIQAYKKEIYLLNQLGEKVDVKVLYFRNIEINNENQLTIHIKPAVREYHNFNDYYSRLMKTMSDMVNNAKDVKRNWKYGIVTTISKGYDAPCCAVIAKKVGCNTAVTFSAEGKYKDDSGVEIANILGYESIIEKDALAFMNRDDCIETFYIATGELGSDISFCSFDNEFSGNLVFTGDRGDSIWEKDSKNRNDIFSFEDVLSHLGCVERRLWIGYISVPMPLYGASAWTSIYDISNSEEMKNWQLGNDYDRPIPRRICEEAGVQREMFGISKHGAGFLYRYDWLARIKKRMSKTAAADFVQYLKKNRRIYLIQTLLYFWKTKEVYLSRLGLKVRRKTSKEYSQIANPTVVRYLIPWAGDYILKKYKKILEE